MIGEARLCRNSIIVKADLDVPLIYSDGEVGIMAIQEMCCSESIKWYPKYSEELAYIIGVLWNGDGTVCISRSRERYRDGIRVRYYYVIQLKVKSRRFAEKFNISMSRVLDKSPVKIREYKGYYIVRFKSKKFVEWWMKILKEPDKKTLKEIALKYPVDYLQGRLDSDGFPNITKYSIGVVGAENNLETLEFDHKLCKSLGLKPTSIKPYYRAGEIRYIGGRKVIAKEDGYRFFIPARNFLKVFNKFNDEHKDERLQYIKKMLSRKDRAKYPEKLKEEIKELLKSGVKKSEIAVKYGIPYKTLEKWKF